jgi:uncharacterized protein YlzI (FlbEa/FlbD family)
VNSDLIKFIERAPDTVLSLTTGDKIVVLETPDEVVNKIIVFRRALLGDGVPSQGNVGQTLAKLTVQGAEVSQKTSGEPNRG